MPVLAAMCTLGGGRPPPFARLSIVLFFVFHDNAVARFGRVRGKEMLTRTAAYDRSFLTTVGFRPGKGSRGQEQGS